MFEFAAYDLNNLYLSDTQPYLFYGSGNVLLLLVKSKRICNGALSF